MSFIFTIVCCTPTSNDFSQEEEKLSDKKLFCLKKYKSVKQQFSFWFFLIFSQAPFFRISNKVDSDSPGYLLSCHGCFFYRRNNFIKFQLRPLCARAKPFEHLNDGLKNKFFSCSLPLQTCWRCKYPCSIN